MGLTDWGARVNPVAIGRRLMERLGPRRAVFVRQLAKLSVIVFVALIALGVAGVEMSAQPFFCKTCHYMRPYYDAWASSSHSDVKCIECHYPPDVGGQLEKKLAASVQLTKYVTRQYGTRPWTEIDDASCLRSGCHSRRLLTGSEEISGSPGVVFDHQPHFASFRRVTRLRCTACHSQMVQGDHMSVTLSTCYTCHFKGRNLEEQVAQCGLCHRRALLEKAEDLAFDHTAVLAREVSCIECHASAVRGTGFVAKERCWVCHSEPERIARFDDTEFMHAQHVTARKIECQLCHETIEHGLPEIDESRTEYKLNCESCHPDAHAETMQLYAGLGAPGAESIPDAMFDAHVTCEACHRSHQKVEGRTVAGKAGSAGCMQCHGEGYGAVLSQWKELAAHEVALTVDGHSSGLMALAESDAAEADRDLAGDLLDRALYNIRFVKHGGGVHNVRYAHNALMEARDKINQAMAMIGADYRMDVLPDLEYSIDVEAAEPSCRKCHSTPPTQSFEIYGTTFDHALHTTEARIDCGRCHDSSKMGEPGHGKMELGAAGCSVCHQSGPMPNPHNSRWRSSHGAVARSTDVQCQVCHGSDPCRSCHGVQLPHPSGWDRKHSQVAQHSPETCARCHTSNTCRNCHGLDMPHVAGWRTEHGTWAASRPDTCDRCHKVDECYACHNQNRPRSHDRPDWALSAGHGQSGLLPSAMCSQCHDDALCSDCHGGVHMPHEPGWQDLHSSRAVADPSGCRLCHESQWCNDCHQDNSPESHRAPGFRSTHGDTPESEQAACKACHGSRDLCTACHGGISMPHPDDWMMAEEHGARAGDTPEGCFTCHPKQNEERTCAVCHEFLAPSSHDDEAFKAQHGKMEGRTRFCELCHDAPACQACHGGLPMPHPDDWLETHFDSEVSSFAAGSACRNCHKPPDCEICHDADEWGG